MNMMLLSMAGSSAQRVTGAVSVVEWQQVNWQKIDWYTARASGIVAWALVSASVILGLLHSSRATKRPRPAWVLDLHRYVAALACLFTLVHVVTLVFDKYIGFGPKELLVPFASKYKPSAVAWGVVATYFLAAIELSSLCMRRIPRRVWHAVHLLSFVVFIMSSVHTLQAGTDRHSLVLRVVVALTLAGVGAACIARVVLRQMNETRNRKRRNLIAQHAAAAAPTLADHGLHGVDEAVREVVRRGETRDCRVEGNDDVQRAVPLDAA